MSGAAKQDELIIVARAVRTRGLKGELVADLLTDFPERFDGLASLCGVSPKGAQTLLKLENHWFQNERVILKFAGYDSVDAAKTLIGFAFGVPEAERVKLEPDEFYDWELEGCVVETNTGSTVGQVREVMRTGGVELLLVENEDRREVLIPMAASILLSVDIAAKKIVIDPPEGLLDL